MKMKLEFRRYCLNLKDRSVFDHDAVSKETIKADLANLGLSEIFVLPSNFTGDLYHVIAAVASVRILTKRPRTAGVFIVARDSADYKRIYDQLSFAFGDDEGVTVVVFHNDQNMPFDRHSGPKAYGEITGAMKAYDVTKATNISSQVVRKQDECPCWPALPVYRRLVETICKTMGANSVTLGNVFRQVCFNFQIKMYNKTVCIWTRTSGQRKGHGDRGGANPQYDSSPLAAAQLCEYFAKLPGFQVLLIGPDCDSIVHRYPKLMNHEDVLVLGPYWNEFRACGASNLTREHENAFFAFLYFAWYCPITHVGMKSGQMDALGALWRQPTLFIHQDTASSVKNRVAKWKIGNRLEPFEVERLPALTGQLIRTLDIQKPSLEFSDWDVIDRCIRYLETGSGLEASELQNFYRNCKPKPSIKEEDRYLKHVMTKLEELRRSIGPDGLAGLEKITNDDLGKIGQFVQDLMNTQLAKLGSDQW